MPLPCIHKEIVHARAEDGGIEATGVGDDRLTIPRLGLDTAYRVHNRLNALFGEEDARDAIAH